MNEKNRNEKSHEAQQLAVIYMADNPGASRGEVAKMSGLSEVTVWSLQERAAAMRTNRLISMFPRPSRATA
ncbi:hypothetical protein KC887_04750 [Candidatus Kaiserbacteria bacterium]|nr:hypothetical protein [Candidatus Kaiserbacteria bacterium]